MNIRFLLFTALLAIAFTSKGQSDFCSFATNITPSFSTCNFQAGSSANATESLPSCTFGGDADDDVWYEFVANSTQMTIRVDPTVGYDPVIELFSGLCSGLTTIQCEDVNGLNGPETITATGLTIGNTYSFRIYNYGIGSGTNTFEVCVLGLAPPSNVNACNAFFMPEVSPACNYLTFTNMGSTGSSIASPPVGSCGGSGTQQGGFAGGDVWFSVIAPPSGELDIHTQSIDFADGAMALYSGSCNALTLEECDDDGDPGDGILMPHIYKTGLTPGDTLFVRVWEHGNNNNGQFAICITTPDNDNCANAQWICDLNGYGGVTSSAYTPDVPGNMCGIGNPLNPTVGCVFGTGYTGPSPIQIDNNSWLQFTANDTIAELFVEISSCQNNNGMQMQIFSGSNCSNFVPVSNFLESTTSQTVMATGLTVGDLYYIVVDGYAGDICSYTITVTDGVQVAEAIASEYFICSGDSTELSAVIYGTGTNTFTWTDENNNFISSDSSLFVSPSFTSEYNLEVSGFCGTTTNASVFIIVTDTPTVNAGADFSMCDNDTAQLNATATGGFGFYTYSWDNGLGLGASKTISSNTSTTYTVTVEGVFGCSSSDAISVAVNSAPTAFAGLDVIICANDTTVLTATGGGNYNWSTNETSASITVSPNITTDYMVIVDNVLCSDSDIVSVTVNPVASTTVDTAICFNNTYSLSNGDMISTTGVYLDTASAINGCDSIITVNLTVNPIFNDTIEVTICDNQTHTLPDNSVVSIAGFYPISYMTTSNCDSIYTTELIVISAFNDTVQVTICNNQTHTLPDNSVVSIAGFYPISYMTTNNCDSIYTTELIVISAFNDTVQVTICNNQTHTLPDNSIVSTTGFYPLSYTSVTNCDSIYTTELIVNMAYNDTVQVTICDNQSHTLSDNSIINIAGFYPLSFMTNSNCDSIYTTELIVNTAYNDTVQVTICDNQMHTLPDNSVVSIAGFYPIIYMTTNNCDSLYTTELIVISAYNDTVQIIICNNQTHTLPDNSVVSIAGFYPLNFMTNNNCDSIYTTELIVNTAYNDTVQVTICDNQTHTLPDNSVVSIAGFYPLSFMTNNNCDSIYTTELIVNTAYNDTVQVTICDNQTHTLPDNSVVSIAGFYPLSFMTNNNCDSVFTTELIIISAYNDTVQVTICDNQTHTLEDNSIVSNPGFYPINYTTASNCDSIYTTELIVNPSFNDTVQVTICDNQTHTLEDNSIVSNPGFYPISYTTATNCDSIYTTELIVNPSFNDTVQVTICENQTHTLEDNSIVSIPGFYPISYMTATNCDSIYTTELIVSPNSNDTIQDSFCENSSYSLPNGDIADTSGTYSVQLINSFGCDSFITYELDMIETQSYSIDTVVGSNSEGYTLPDGTIATEDGAYLSELTSIFGCDSSILINLRVIEEWGIPNAFSPNSSQSENAVFTIVNQGSIVKISMLQVYNRWGEKVFDNNEAGLDYWDGYYKGILQSAGNYTYLLNVVDSKGVESKPYAGNFLLFW